jgi:hypothetical protein
MLCSPSYAAHKLQPLDRTFTKSFKGAYFRVMSTYNCHWKFILLYESIYASIIISLISLLLLGIGIYFISKLLYVITIQDKNISLIKLFCVVK